MALNANSKYGRIKTYPGQKPNPTISEKGRLYTFIENTSSDNAAKLNTAVSRYTKMRFLIRDGVCLTTKQPMPGYVSLWVESDGVPDLTEFWHLFDSL